jgi:beta-phosphoglucomutase
VPSQSDFPEVDVMFETAIFDWDGTLADTRPAILFSFHNALKGIGADVSDKQIERLIGIGSAATFRELLRSQGKVFSKELIQNLVAKKVSLEIDYAGQVNLFPGALELLQSLSGKVNLGLASMNNRAVVDRLLVSTKTDRFFTVTVTADEITQPKPNPEIFLKTAKKFKTPPSQCAVLEDSIFGVKAAKAAAMACIAVAQNAYTRDELAKAEPDLVLSSLTEKDTILDFILN